MGFTVREVVAMGRAPHQGAWMRPSEADDVIISEALERCDLVSLARRPAHALSGGEQKRVAIARATAPRPAIIFADEPTGNLDASTGEAVMRLLFARADETRATLFIITHDEKLAARCARVLTMRDGKIVSDTAG